MQFFLVLAEQLLQDVHGLRLELHSGADDDSQAQEEDGVPPAAAGAVYLATYSRHLPVHYSAHFHPLDRTDGRLTKVIIL